MDGNLIVLMPQGGLHDNSPAIHRWEENIKQQSHRDDWIWCKNWLFSTPIFIRPHRTPFSFKSPDFGPDFQRAYV